MSPGGRAAPDAEAARPRLVLATTNPGKLREMSALLAPWPLAVGGLPDAPPVAFPEEGDDYRRNAEAKALAAARATGVAALADDSGLEVDALGGAPGPRSARYGGPGLDDAGRVQKLLAALADVPPSRRTARFVCVVALALPGGRLHVARGVCEGRIAGAPRGGSGFGYDPVFEVADAGAGSAPPGGGLPTMAQLSAGAKNRLSHRARAILALAPALRALAGGGPAGPPGSDS